MNSTVKALVVPIPGVPGPTPKETAHRALEDALFARRKAATERAITEAAAARAEAAYAEARRLRDNAVTADLDAALVVAGAIDAHNAAELAEANAAGRPFVKITLSDFRKA